MKLQLELRSTGGNTAGFQIPDDVVETLGGGKRPKVVATVNGHTWRSSIARMGGEFWLGMSMDNRARAGVAAGDVLGLELELDTAKREIDVPEDLAAELATDPQAKAFWDGMSYSNQRWHAEQITGAKQAETRVRRVAKSMAMLREGRAR
jgi:hypothetical protein